MPWCQSHPWRKEHHRGRIYNSSDVYRHKDESSFAGVQLELYKRLQTSKDVDVIVGLSCLEFGCRYSVHISVGATPSFVRYLSNSFTYLHCQGMTSTLRTIGLFWSWTLSEFLKLEKRNKIRPSPSIIWKKWRERKRKQQETSIRSPCSERRKKRTCPIDTNIGTIARTI